MSLLETIEHPADLRRLGPDDLTVLAAEVRGFLIEKVTRSGGHLGPNLGVVELTFALHRVFDSATDRLLWDTGHQCYVHKLLTGRRAGFDRLRQRDGISGYPCRGESEHDIIENSHASTALSYGDGLARAFALRGVTDRSVVVVVGDGSLTGGMAWEALNNIGGSDRPVVVVLNDNGRSYAPTVGGIARHLAGLRLAAGQPAGLAGTGNAAADGGGPEVDGGAMVGAASRTGNVFENLGFSYLGPIDGHDVATLEETLRAARDLHRPVVVHCVTRKGAGHPPAEQNELDLMHVVRATDPDAPTPAGPAKESWTGRFGKELVAVARERPEVVAITAAMLEPTGLVEFQRHFPDRVVDVGIAEQHAVTSAVGLAMGGMHPVIALYATFVNRAFDQLLTDLALHGQAATFVLDRAGVTGDDGPSHNGMWDLSLLQVVPGISIAAPRDGARLAETLREAVARTDGPTVVRFPKGALPAELPAVRRVAGVDVLAEPAGPAEVLLIGAGAMASVALGVAERLAEQGHPATVVDPRWVVPVNPVLVELAARHRLVVTVEDNVRVGGVGSAVAQALRDARVSTPLRDFGIPHRFLDHGDRGSVLTECGLTAQQICLDLVGHLADLSETGQEASRPLAAAGIGGDAR